MLEGYELGYKDAVLSILKDIDLKATAYEQDVRSSFLKQDIFDAMQKQQACFELYTLIAKKYIPEV